jgi:hypothetical protein
MVTNRLAAIICDDASDFGSDVESLLLLAIRAPDAFQTIVVRHALCSLLSGSEDVGSGGLAVVAATIAAQSWSHSSNVSCS